MIPDRHRPRILHEDLANEKHQRNPQQILDLQFSSPKTNSLLNSMKAKGVGTMVHSPVRGTELSPTPTVKNTKVSKGDLPPLSGLAPNPKRMRNKPEFATQDHREGSLKENRAQSIVLPGQSTPQRRRRNLPNHTESKFDPLKTGFEHYDNSPVAKHYVQDPGFLMTFNGTIKPRIGVNRRLKMRDTFTKLFPTYSHEPKTVYSPSAAHTHFLYPERQYDGRPTFKIDRTYTHKMDEIKTYTEEMLKIVSIADMRKFAKK